MANSPTSTEDHGDGPRGAPRTPRWVKVFAVIAVVLVVLLVVGLLTGGSHGPGRHQSSGDVGGRTTPANATTSGGHDSSAGGHTQ